MTIRELNQIAEPELKIRVSFSGSSEPLNRYDGSLQMMAYGGYEIARIDIMGDGLEAVIKTVPVRGE